jgi:hypothetical protein
VLFLLAAKDIDNVAVWINNLVRRGHRAGVRRFPSVHGATPSHPSGLLPRAVNGAKTIFE